MSHVQSLSSPNRGLLIWPDARHGRNFSSLSRALYSSATYLYASPSFEFCQHKVFPRLIHNARKSGRCAPVYASGRKGDSMGENEVGFLWLQYYFCFKVVRMCRLWRQGMCLMPFWPCCKASALAGHVTISYVSISCSMHPCAWLSLTGSMQN